MNTIDAILYINLDKREDRKKDIEKQFKKIGFNINKIHRISAIKNDECGHLGCGQSHVLALEFALKNNWKRIMILEDDYEFKISKRELNTFINQADKLNWDVLLLSLGHNELCEKNGDIRKVISSTTTSGYIVKHDYIDKLLKNFKESNEITKKELVIHREKNKEKNPIPKFVHGVTAIDYHWGILQREDNFYTRDPPVGDQNHFSSSDTF
jgi:GR25 family glycosyltransferase involved in LPS biosynthesis